ncbi:MAG TPA: hypothetical protein VJH88_03540 [Candidatus Nanoarchaeia archaeon]|nr:hypothetical protein [Candidatus Nanoarchaeia archaeon]
MAETQEYPSIAIKNDDARVMMNNNIDVKRQERLKAKEAKQISWH